MEEEFYFSWGAEVTQCVMEELESVSFFLLIGMLTQRKFLTFYTGWTVKQGKISHFSHWMGCESR